MIGIQIGAILFALWMYYFTYLHYRRREFSIYEFGFWFLLWTGLVAVVLFPNSVNFLLRAFSINRTFDFVVIVGIVVLFGITFRNYVLLRRLDRRLEQYARRDALEKMVPPR